MKIGQILVVIIGAALGSLVAVWWVRKNGLPMLPANAQSEAGASYNALEGETSSWIRLD